MITSSTVGIRPAPSDAIDTVEWERDLGVHETFGVSSRRVVRKEAVGVVAAIGPWNYPMEAILSKVVAALAAGNTVVVEAAPDTPFSALRIGRVALERTSLPPGVINVLTSSDAAVGEALVADPRVDMISFTGSTATGRQIMEVGAPTLKRLFLELGGRSAHILLGGGVSAADPARALAVANRLRTGSVGINNTPTYGSESPFGGYKASGIGRQSGREGFEQYLETKTIGVPA